LPNQPSASFGIAELMVSKALFEVNIKLPASSDSGILRSAAAGCSAHIERVATGAVIHEITRTALQRLELLMSAPDCSSGISPSSATRAAGKERNRDQYPAFKHVRDPFRHGFTLSNFVYQGISKKNAKYKTVQTLASIGYMPDGGFKPQIPKEMNDRTKMANITLYMGPR